MVRSNMTDTAGKHDRLVVSPHLACYALLEGAEISRKVRPPEFVVERRAANRPFQHYLQGRSDTVRLAVDSPRPLRANARLAPMAG